MGERGRCGGQVQGGGQVKHRGIKKQTGLSDLSVHFHYCGGGRGGAADWLNEGRKGGWFGLQLYKYINKYILP